MNAIVPSLFSSTPIVSHPQQKDAPYITKTIAKFGVSEDDLPECMVYKDLNKVINRLIQNEGKMVVKKGKDDCSKKSIVHLITLVEQKENILGVALFECSIKKKKLKETRKSTLWQLVIDPSHQRKGYGSIMLAHIINFLCMKRISKLKLNSTTAGLKLYFRAGMLPIDQFKEIKNKKGAELLEFWKKWHPIPLKEKASNFKFLFDHENLIKEGIPPPQYLFLSLKDPLSVITCCFMEAVSKNKDYRELLQLSGIETISPQFSSLSDKANNLSISSSTLKLDVAQKSSGGTFSMDNPSVAVINLESRNCKSLQETLPEQKNKKRTFSADEDANSNALEKKTKINSNYANISESSSLSYKTEEQSITSPVTEKEIDDFVASFFS
ncbi:MAG: GNAT family N-acetyltransferase [Parachlamydiales bacterium]|nr:GNAT family N-acetyltransferase [Verrucomicrobiota bacterium]